MFLPSKLSLKCFTVFWSGFLGKKHFQMSQYTADTFQIKVQSINGRIIQRNEAKIYILHLFKVSIGCN